MLNFIYPYLAWAYLFLSFSAQLGVLQLVATRRRLGGLSFGDYRERPRMGYILGALLIVVPLLWFFLTYEEIFWPGPAGSELSFLFAVAALLAVGTTLLVPDLRRRLTERHRSVEEEAGQEVATAVFRGTLLLPAEAAQRVPAICLVPAPGVSVLAQQRFAEALQQQGLATLVVDFRVGFPSYPEVLALMPSAMSFLSSHPKLDAQRLGVLGLDLGGNVAVRSASTDQRIRAVVAVGALLGEQAARPGLSLLREMTYSQALQWARFRGRDKLIAELAMLEHVGEGTTRKLLLWGEFDGLVPPEDRHQVAERIARMGNKAPELRIAAGETHVSLLENEDAARLVAGWFAERLSHVA